MEDCMRAINSSRDSLGVESMTRSSVRKRDLVYLDQFLQRAPGKLAAPNALATQLLGMAFDSLS
jgi:hypothetical protein